MCGKKNRRDERELEEKNSSDHFKNLIVSFVTGIYDLYALGNSMGGNLAYKINARQSLLLQDSRQGCL